MINKLKWPHMSSDDVTTIQYAASAYACPTPYELEIHDIAITSCENRPKAIFALKKVLGISLFEAKQIVDNLPKIIYHDQCYNELLMRKSDFESLEEAGIELQNIEK